MKLHDKLYFDVIISLKNAQKVFFGKGGGESTTSLTRTGRYNLF